MHVNLHGYWRSGAAYRTRIALNLKGLGYDQTPVDLRAGSQKSEAYRALNPQGLVPALEVDGAVITQSLAIFEWLEEAHPTPPLLPADLLDRARVRAMVGLVACDIHPLGNLRVLNSLRHDLGADEAAVSAWIARWIGEGFAALETMVGDQGWCFGDAPTLADCCLIPQIYAAERFGVDLTPFPTISAIGKRAADHHAFAAAHPSRQPDAD